MGGLEFSQIFEDDIHRLFGCIIPGDPGSPARGLGIRFMTMGLIIFYLLIPRN